MGVPRLLRVADTAAKVPARNMKAVLLRRNRVTIVLMHQRCLSCFACCTLLVVAANTACHWVMARFRASPPVSRAILANRIKSNLLSLQKSLR